MTYFLVYKLLLHVNFQANHGQGDFEIVFMQLFKNVAPSPGRPLPLHPKHFMSYPKLLVACLFMTFNLLYDGNVKKAATHRISSYVSHCASISRHCAVSLTHTPLTQSNSQPKQKLGLKSIHYHFSFRLPLPCHRLPLRPKLKGTNLETN